MDPQRSTSTMSEHGPLRCAHKNQAWMWISTGLLLLSSCERPEPQPTPVDAPIVVGRLDASIGPKHIPVREPLPKREQPASLSRGSLDSKPESNQGGPERLQFRFADSIDPKPSSEPLASSLADPSAAIANLTAASDRVAASPSTRPLVSGPAAPRYIAMAREIQEQVSCLRGRAFVEDVSVEFQSIEDFTAFVQTEIDRETKTARGRREARMLKALGFIQFDDDLGDIVKRATIEQAAAYYDPKQNTFFIVKQMPDFMLRATMAHELQHALQDQHSFTLDTYTEGRFETHDAALAARFLVEGEASLVGNAWTMMAAGELPMFGQVVPSPCGTGPGARENTRLFWSALRDMNVKLAGQTRQQIQNPGLMERMLTRALSPSVAESMATLGDLPNYIYFTLVLPYTFGSYAMYEVLEDQQFAWKGIDRLFEALPQTTAEMLHPRRIGHVKPTPPPPLWEPTDHPFDTKGWRADPTDRLGELALRIWLIDGGIPEREAATLAAGWASDRVRVWSRQRAGAPSLAFDLHIQTRKPAHADALKQRVFDALEHRRGTLELIGDVSPLAGMEGVLSYGYDGPRGRRSFGRLAWSQNGLVLTEGWSVPPKAIPSDREPGSPAPTRR